MGGLAGLAKSRMTVLATALTPSGEGAWVGTDGACTIAATYRPLVASGKGRTREEAEDALTIELASLVRSVRAA